MCVNPEPVLRRVVHISISLRTSLIPFSAATGYSEFTEKYLHYPNDKAFRHKVRERAALSPDTGREYAWFVFHIHAIVGGSRDKPRQVPDVENIPKLIIDAFTGVLYDDDNLNFCTSFWCA